MQRSLAVIILSFIVTLSLPGPGFTRAVSQSERTNVTISYQPMASPGGLVFSAVKRDRILRQALARNGKTLAFISSAKGGDTIRQLKTSEAVFATIADMPLLEALATIPLKTIAQLKSNYSMVVGKRGDTPKDLKGKRIGYAVATTGHFALLKALTSVGLTENDVTLVTMEINEMPEALRKGKIDAFAAWDPTASSTIAQSPDRFAAISRQSSNAFFVVSRSFAEQNPTVSKEIAAAIVRSMRWLKKSKANLELAAKWNSTDITALTGKTPIMSVSDIARFSSDDLNALSYTPKISRRIATSNSLLAEELVFLKNMGKVPPTTAWESICKNFDFAIIDYIMRNPAKYSLDRFDYEE